MRAARTFRDRVPAHLAARCRQQARILYARLNIREYFIFDPERRYLTPPLQGFRSVKGRSVPIRPRGDGSLYSKELRLLLKADGVRLLLIDPNTREVILTPAERAERETERADALAAENERLRARIAQLES